MENFYNVTRWLSNPKTGGSKVIKGTVEFYCNEDDYGNGYGMFIKADDEPFQSQAYDIRYDDRFTPYNMMGYILMFYQDRYSESEWNLDGIRIHVAEEIKK